MAQAAASSPSSSGPHAPGRAVNAALWSLQILVAAAFLGAGGAKLAGVPMMVEVFTKVGVGQWFRYVTGALEIAGAVGLLIPRATFYAAALLVAIMAGAVLAHLTVLGGSPAAPVVLLLLSGAIAYFRKRV